MAIETKILYIKAFTVTGTATRIRMGSESTELFRSIWNEFESWRQQFGSHSTDRCYYGVSFRTDQEGIIEYVAGMAVEKAETVPECLAVREVPGGDYAVFACPVQAIGEAYRHFFGDWLPGSGYQLDGSAPTFEKYPPAEDTASPVLIHLPIRQKGQKQ